LECKACLVRVCSGEASLALPAYYKYSLIVGIAFSHMLT